jgi:hypothetical protein
VLLRKFILICFLVFASLIDANLRKINIGGEKGLTLTDLVDGMGGVMSQRSLKGGKMQEHMQGSVGDGALALCNVNEEHVQANVEDDLQKNIEMIVEQ